MKRRRIVSLLPSATEMVCALGCRDQLVGRSHECDFPTDVSGVPVCTESKILPDSNSRAINEQVRNLTAASLSIYRVNEKRLLELKPDIILTQTQCDVCAVSEKEVARAVEKWLGARPRVVSFSPVRLGDVWDDLQRLAAILECKQRGHEVLKALKTRCVNVIEKSCLSGRKPTAACIEWLDPLMAAGNWVPDLVEMAGGKNLFGERGQHSDWMTWEQVREANPDFLILMPCGFDIARTVEELGLLRQKSGWAKLKAVKNNQVVVVDASAYFNRPGPRLVDSLETLGEIIHPEFFQFGHKGKAWVRV